MFPTTQTNISNLNQALKQSKVQQTQTGAGGKAFIKFDFKDGSFSFGRDREDITGDQIVINTATFAHGWVLWVNGNANKVMRSFIEDLPDPMPSQDGNHPAEARGFEARFTDEDDTVLIFETNSYGGRKGCDTLLAEVAKRSMAGEEDYLYPVVQLESESYQAKQGGTIHNPVFKVVGWMNQAGDMEGEQAKAIEEKAAEPEPTEEKEKAAPQRRRRRA